MSMMVLPLLLSFTLFFRRLITNGGGIIIFGEMLKAEHVWSSVGGDILNDEVEG